MRYLLDTGILARLPHRADPLNAIVRDAIKAIALDGHTLVTATQNIAEFWNLCTRPSEARGGFGPSPQVAFHRLQLLERMVNILREPESAYAKWKKLVVAHNVRGKQVHDARLVALMNAYRIKRILTLNTHDFDRYGSVIAISPQQLVGQ